MTAGVVVLLRDPRGIAGEFTRRPAAVSVTVVVVFLGLVALYCRALQRTLAVVRPDARTVAPASVWWMFAVPFNFAEDFFIVRNVTGSLAADGRIPARAVGRWSALGYGWCGLQIVSLFPGAIGYAGGSLALPVWAAHWYLTSRLNRTLG
ncbi:hypothetical protein [Actinoplanes sp. NPDC049118]|uniref:hypothetical protein n=1 Tax=Actinoplanes sp. NPDC049118 TaxID=3155769 RepID=UPI0033C679D6